MKLAINYSHPAANLIQAGKIRIDCFKTPDWEWMIDEAMKINPVAVHFTLEIGNGNLEKIDWQKIIRIRNMTNTPYINFHLDSRGTYFPGISVESNEISDVQRVYEVIQADLYSATNQIGTERIIIENSPYRGKAGGTMRACIEPDLINRLLDDTGCGLLLDISHAIITAKTIGMDPTDYMNQLPMNRLKEMHFAGIHMNPMSGIWMDHLSVQEEDWYWLDWVLEHIKREEWTAPWMLAFEYGGVGEPFEWRTNPQVIAEQVPQIYERLQQLTYQ
jgi:uncharacterized protein (UPF0276 family)